MLITIYKNKMDISQTSMVISSKSSKKLTDVSKMSTLSKLCFLQKPQMRLSNSFFFGFQNIPFSVSGGSNISVKVQSSEFSKYSAPMQKKILMKCYFCHSKLRNCNKFWQNVSIANQNFVRLCLICRAFSIKILKYLSFPLIQK